MLAATIIITVVMELTGLPLPPAIIPMVVINILGLGKPFVIPVIIASWAYHMPVRPALLIPVMGRLVVPLALAATIVLPPV
jgi:hypothetical protein